MNGEAVIKTKEIWKFFMKKMAISFQAECNFGFPVGSDSKESACNAGDLGSIPGLERSLGEVNGNPLSILAQRIPSIEEPGGQQSMGLQSRTQLKQQTCP